TTSLAAWAPGWTCPPAGLGTGDRSPGSAPPAAPPVLEHVSPGRDPGRAEPSDELEGKVVGKLATAGDVQLGENRLEVVLHGVGGDVQAAGNLPGAHPGQHPPDHLALPPGEPIGGGEQGQDGRWACGPDYHGDALRSAVGRGDALAMQRHPVALDG